MVDEALWLPSSQGSYGIVETGHSLLCDVVTTCLMEDLADAADRPTLDVTHVRA
jgi:hypothetical protein